MMLQTDQDPLISLLKNYHRRPLDVLEGYKPLDFGGGAITGSINQDGRIIALNTYHSHHGYVTLTSAPPFPESERYNAESVRLYRHRLTELDGYGLQFDSPIIKRETWLIENAVPYIRLTLATGAIAEVITFVPHDHPIGVIQIWHFSESGIAAQIAGRLWLQRSAYTQLTEGGPALMPSVQTKVKYDGDVGVFWLHNPDLGCAAAFQWNDGIETADGSVDFTAAARLTPQESMLQDRQISQQSKLLPFVIAETDDEARANFVALRDADVYELLARTLTVWRNRWRGWQYDDHPLDLSLRRALVYGYYCCVPVTEEATCIITDHMLLPLSWNRDSYYVARSLLYWRSEMAAYVQRHLIWMFEVAERTEEGAWARAYLANGRIKDSGYQFDQQIYPLLELAEYVLLTNDVDTWNRLQPHIMPAIDMLMSTRKKGHWLFPTEETPADDPIAYPYHLSSHMLLWRTFKMLARLSSDGPYEHYAAQLHAEIEQSFIAEHEAGEIYAYATDGEGQHHLYHDANDVPLVLAPAWKFTRADHPIWRRTVDFAFSGKNKGGEYNGLLGSVHTKAPWPLGDAQDIIIARALYDTKRERAAWERLSNAAQWDGALSEAYSASNFRVVSRSWFVWPNAMLANIYTGHASRDFPNIQWRSYPMKIGFIATRLGGADGVSQETERMAQILTEMGNECYFVAGQFMSDTSNSWHIPSMHFYDPVALKLHNEAFRTANPSRKTIQRIYSVADSIRSELESFVEEFELDMLVSQNASTIPMNISLGVAIADLIKRRRIRTICHHHDFYWERERFINNGIEDILKEAFPPRLEPIQHVVVNSLMKRRLDDFRGIDANLLPNVFDFENPPAPPDDYARSLRGDLGLNDDDIIILQPSRCIRRKSIQKSIELVRRLNDDRLVLLVTGNEDDEPSGYGPWLREEADRAGIRYQFIGHRVSAERGMKDGQRLYTMGDIYRNANIGSFPSIYEGFGNVLIEMMYYGVPFVVHTYPSYIADIQSVGVRAVEFYYDLTDDVLKQVRDIIDNKRLRSEIAAHNYDVGLDHFSFRVLRRVMNDALGRLHRDGR